MKLYTLIFLLFSISLFGCRKTVNKTNPEFVGTWMIIDNGGSFNNAELIMTIEENGKAEVIDRKPRDGYNGNLRGRAIVKKNELPQPDELIISTPNPTKIFTKSSPIYKYPYELDTPITIIVKIDGIEQTITSSISMQLGYTRWIKAE